LLSDIEWVLTVEDKTSYPIPISNLYLVAIDQLIGWTHLHTLPIPISMFLSRVLIFPFLKMAESEFDAVAASPLMGVGWFIAKSSPSTPSLAF